MAAATPPGLLVFTLLAVTVLLHSLHPTVGCVKDCPAGEESALLSGLFPKWTCKSCQVGTFNPATSGSSWYVRASLALAGCHLVLAFAVLLCFLRISQSSPHRAVVLIHLE
jgi:hypothetical protein